MAGRYSLTSQELSEAYKRHQQQAQESYDRTAEEFGKEYADKMAGEIFDGHSCSDFSVNGGYCDFCGSIVTGSPVDRRERDYDLPDFYSDDDVC